MYFALASADFLRCAKATLSSLQTLAPIMILLGRKVFSVRSMVPLDLRVFRQGRDVWNTGHYPIVTDAARQEINDLCNLAYPPLEAQPEIKVHAVSPTRPEVAISMKRAVSTNSSTGKPNVSPQAKRKKTNHPVPVIILE